MAGFVCNNGSAGDVQNGKFRFQPQKAVRVSFALTGRIFLWNADQTPEEDAGWAPRRFRDSKGMKHSVIGADDNP